MGFLSLILEAFFMQFESINKSYCWFFLLFLIACEIVLQIKGNKSLQSEIYIKKIDIINDRPGVVNLLPGVGEKKLAEILELRKTEKSASKILEMIGLKNKLEDSDSVLMEE